MMNDEKVLIVTTMKNEGPYLLEWVAHHLAIGVDDILVFTNDCDDGTERMLARLGQIAPVHQAPNPKALFPNKGNWQVMALRYARLFNVYKEADWIYHTDADEFLQITVGDGSLNAFHLEALERAGRFDAVSFTSIPFSSGGEMELNHQRVTKRFTHLNKPYAKKRAAGESVFNAIKTMFRNEVKFDLRRNHRPLMHNFSRQGHVWIDGSARVLPTEFTDGSTKAIDATKSIDLAQMNHYAIKCAESFLVKLDRGDVAGTSRLAADGRYWAKYNTHGDCDDRFTQMRPSAHTLLDQFLSDPELNELHNRALEIHKEKAKRLRADPAWGEITHQLGFSTSVPPISASPIAELKDCATGLPEIASFWTGDPLSYIEHLVIRSYLDAGHRFVLYALDDIGPVPDGVEIRDARTLFTPDFPVGTGRRHNNAVYSDLFRLIMVQKTGAIWVDLDAYCLRPFRLPTSYVFGFELPPDRIANGVLGLPPDSPALAQMIELISQRNPIPPFLTRKTQKRYLEAAARGENFGFESFTWGVSGPRLVSHFLRETGEARFASSKNVFYPGPRAHTRPLLKPDVPSEIFEQPETISVHFWGKTKKFLVDDYNGVPPKGSYLDRLLKRHQIDTAEFPLQVSNAIERQSLR